MTVNDSQSGSDQEARKRSLNKQLEAIGWGLFLIMIGGLWLVPDEMVREGTWLIGAGLIMLGLNAARYYVGIKMSRFSVALGIIALAVGLTDFFGLDLPLVPILIILFGASIIWGVLTRED